MLDDHCDHSCFDDEDSRDEGQASRQGCQLLNQPSDLAEQAALTTLLPKVEALYQETVELHRAVPSSRLNEIQDQLYYVRKAIQKGLACSS